jgi:hypothetical protein
MIVPSQQRAQEYKKGSCPWPKESGALGYKCQQQNVQYCAILIVWFRLPKNM